MKFQTRISGENGVVKFRKQTNRCSSKLLELAKLRQILVCQIKWFTLLKTSLRCYLVLRVRQLFQYPSTNSYQWLEVHKAGNKVENENGENVHKAIYNFEASLWIDYIV